MIAFSSYKIKIIVKVKPGARKNEVKKIDVGEYEVSTTAQPEKGRANEAVIDLLAKYFKIPKSRIYIMAGHFARAKIVEVV